MCVQRFDDSLNSAIHTTYRISLRSSSMPEPRDPLLKVLILRCACAGRARSDETHLPKRCEGGSVGGRNPPRKQTSTHEHGWGGKPASPLRPHIVRARAGKGARRNARRQRQTQARPPPGGFGAAVGGNELGGRDCYEPNIHEPGGRLRPATPRPSTRAIDLQIGTSRTPRASGLSTPAGDRLAHTNTFADGERPRQRPEGSPNRIPRNGGTRNRARWKTVMILPQVHLRNGAVLATDSANSSACISAGARPYLKQLPAAGATHYHLACEQRPWRPRRRGTR
jgi:hypothetical protein